MAEGSDRWESLPSPRAERVCGWLLRVTLPVLLALCGLLIFWMWFDNVYGDDAWSAVGGLLVALATIPLTLWTWESWSKVKAF